MNKKEFNECVAKKTKLSQAQIHEVTNAALQVIVEAIMNNNKVSFLGFGSFEPINRSERMGRNPQTGEPAVIKACKTVKFKPSKELISLLNNK